MRNKNKKKSKERKAGFWKIETNAFDRVFIAVIIMVAVHLLWMRFLEEYITIRVANVLAIVFIYVSVRWG